MGFGNVSERRSAPPQVGVSVVILALGPEGDTGNSAADSGNAANSAHSRLCCPWSSASVSRSWAAGRCPAVTCAPTGRWNSLPTRPSNRPQTCTRDTSNSCTPLEARPGPMADCPWYPSCTRALVGQTEAAGFEDGDNVRWFPEDELPELAFDHRQIIDYALLRLRSKIEYSDVAIPTARPPRSPLRQLHGVYEAIGGEPLDLANFRRKMLASGDLEDTGEKMREGRQRPATVYRYIPKRPVENGTPHESDGDDIVELSRQGEREDALDALIPSARI